MTVSRTRLLAVLAVAVTAALAVIASPSLATPRRAQAHAASAATIQLRRTRLGMILVDSRGFTVFGFTHDPRNKDTCVSIKECTKFWPPIRTSGKPRAGSGVKRSLLGTIRIPGGLQVTYAGHALYGYTGDSSPGATSYVGVNALGGVWYALRSTGAMVR